MKLFKKMTITLFICMFVLAIFGKFLPYNNITPFFKKDMAYWLQNSIEIISLLIAIVGMYLFWNRKLKFQLPTSTLFRKVFPDSVKKQKWIFLFLYFVLNVLVLNIFKNPPGWDYRTLIYDSEHLIRGTGIGLREYLMQYPNNLLYAFFIYPIIFCFGADNTVTIVVWLNIGLIVLSLSVFYDMMYKITGSLKRTRYASILFICFLPLIYYNQTFYSDTISLPLVLIAINWLFEAGGKFTDSKKKLILAIALLVFASVIKASVLVVTVAVGILCLMNYKGFKKLYSLLVVVSVYAVKIIMLGLVALWSFFYPPLYNKSVADVGYPESSWICMAQNDVARGNYDFQDAYRTRDLYRDPNATKADVDTVMKACIKERIVNRSVLGNFHFFFRKYAFTWSDSTFYAVHNLGVIYAPEAEQAANTNVWNVTGNSSITKNNLYLEQGVFAVGHYIFLNTYQNIVYIAAVIVGFKMFKKKKTGDLFDFIVLTTLGYGAFHLLWEARSRYILTVFIMLLMLIFVYGQIKPKTSKE